MWERRPCVNVESEGDCGRRVIDVWLHGHILLSVRISRDVRANLNSCRTFIIIIIIIITNGQQLCPVVGRRPQHAASNLTCIVLSSARSCPSSICPLVAFRVVWSPSGDTRYPSVVLRRLMSRAQDHFIFLTLLITSMTFVLSLTQMFSFLSLYVTVSIILARLFRNMYACIRSSAGEN